VNKEQFYARKDDNGKMMQDSDRRVERLARQTVEDYWDIDVEDNGDMSVIDWHGRRPGAREIIANFEFKGRNDPIDRFDTVFCPTHKFLGLVTQWWYLKIPGFFVAQWEDGQTRYVNAAYVEVGKTFHAGAAKIRGSEQKPSQEPCLEILISSMTPIDQAPILRAVR
jgi:hypothetical protein